MGESLLGIVLLTYRYLHLPATSRKYADLSENASHTLSDSEAVKEVCLQSKSCVSGLQPTRATETSFLVCVTFFSISQLVVKECLQTRAHLPTGDWNKATTWRMTVCLGMCKHPPILPSSRQHPPGTHQPVRECMFYLCGCITSNTN